MARARYESCPTCPIRATLEKRLRLPSYTPARKNAIETPAGFWSRVEKAGLLVQAVSLYDQMVAEHRAWVHTPCETKKAFAARVEREGRAAEAERVRAELLGSGLSQRAAQQELVARFQPLDGSKTPVCGTPPGGATSPSGRPRSCQGAEGGRRGEGCRGEGSIPARTACSRSGTDTIAASTVSRGRARPVAAPGKTTCTGGYTALGKAAGSFDALADPDKRRSAQAAGG
jgi:hypothetical protein